MTPEEKAIELVEKYAIWNWTETACNYEGVKDCALIAVDEILLYLKNSDDVMTSIKAVDYWQEVKNEIESL